MKSIGLAALALTAALAAAACTTRAAEPEPVEDEPPSASTRWVRAPSARGLSWLEAPAKVLPAPESTAAVSVPLSARVLRVRVQPGQVVKEGEPLVDVLMPELTRAAGALSAASIRLEAYQKRRERVAPLVEEGLARAAEVAELDASIALARADRESARATLRAAGLTDAAAKGLLEGSGAVALRAPVSGMVVAVSAQLGEAREPSGGPLVELASNAAVQIEARFSAAPPQGVAPEWVAQNESAPLVLDAISPRASGTDGARVGWLHVAEGHPSPPAGALGRVRIKPPEDWVVVPVRALTTNEGGAAVQAQGERGVQSLPVQVVLRTSSEAVVTGLKPDTLIAADATRAAEQTP